MRADPSKAGHHMCAVHSKTTGGALTDKDGGGERLVLGISRHLHGGGWQEGTHKQVGHICGQPKGWRAHQAAAPVHLGSLEEDVIGFVAHQHHDANARQAAQACWRGACEHFMVGAAGVASAARQVQRAATQRLELT